MEKLHDITQDEYEALKIKFEKAETEFFRKISMDNYDPKDLEADYIQFKLLKVRMAEADEYAKVMWDGYN